MRRFASYGRLFPGFSAVAAAVGGIPNLSPGGSWNGTASSGYTVAPLQTGTAVTNQQTSGNMNGAIAPDLGWIFTENVYPDALFTDDITLLLSSLEADSVTVYCEGNTATPTKQQVSVPVCTGEDGSLNATFGTMPGAAYPVTIKHSDFSGNGAIDLYAKAMKAGQADRIIGPLRLFRRVDLNDGKFGYDVMKTVGTGGDYTTAQAALNARATAWVSGTCELLKAVSNLDLDENGGWLHSQSTTNAKRGTVVFDANGFTVTCKNSAALPKYWRPGFNGLVLKGVRVDVSNIAQIYSDGGAAGVSDLYRNLVFIRSTIYGGGQFELAQSDTTVSNANAKTVRSTGVFRDEVALVSCLVRDMNMDTGAFPFRTGNYFKRCSGDIFFTGNARGFSGKALFNTIHDCGPSGYTNGVNAFSFYKTGGGTPGVRFTGPHNSSARKVIVCLNGTDVDAGITLSTTFGTGTYSTAQLVSLLNSTYNASGYVFTLLNDTYRAAMIGPETDTTVIPGGTSSGTAVIVKAYAWQHCDGVQFGSDQLHDNVIIDSNRFLGFDGQIFFPSIQNPSCNSYNCVIVNNAAMLVAAGNYAADAYQSQIAGDHFNLRIWHNTLPNQGLQIRNDAYDTDLAASVSFKSNVFKWISQVSASNAAGVTNAATFQNNVSLTAGFNPITTTGTNTGNTIGATTPLTEFPETGNAASTLTLASFSPIVGGLVRSNPKAPANSNDIAGTTRANPSLAGALAA